MEYLIALALSALAGWLLSRYGSRALDGQMGAITALVGGWRREPWPRGVQEEDRDRPWSWPVARTLSSPSSWLDESVVVKQVPATRVRPRIRRG